eukprot:1417302-Amphidinium_carterae.1
MRYICDVLLQLVCLDLVLDAPDSLVEVPAVVHGLEDFWHSLNCRPHWCRNSRTDRPCLVLSRQVRGCHDLICLATKQRSKPLAPYLPSPPCSVLGLAQQQCRATR